MTNSTIFPTINTTVPQVHRHPHSKDDDILEGMYIFALVYIFVAAIATFLVNGLTLYAIYKDPLKCFRNPLAIFVTGVLAADFVTGLVGELVFAAGISHLMRTGDEIGVHVLLVGAVVFAAATTISFLSLLALAISQLLAIGWMRRYERCVTNRSAKIGVASIWTITIILCVVLSIMTWWWVFRLMIIEVTLSTIVLVILYIVSYHIFRKRVNRSENPLENQVVTKEFFKGTFLLALVQIVTVWPYVSSAIGIRIYMATNRRSRIGWVDLHIVQLVCRLLFLAKFVADPVILVWRIPKYRKSLKTVYASYLGSCGCSGDEMEGRAAYNETRREDFDEDSQDKVNVEVI